MEKVLYEKEDTELVITEEMQRDVSDSMMEFVGEAAIINSLSDSISDLQKDVSKYLLTKTTDVNIIGNILGELSTVFTLGKVLLTANGITGDMIDNNIGTIYYQLYQQMDELSKTKEKLESEKEDVDLSDAPEDTKSISVEDAGISSVSIPTEEEIEEIEEKTV